MEPIKRGWDNKWLVGSIVGILGLVLGFLTLLVTVLAFWVGWQQLKIAELQTAEQQRIAVEQRKKEAINVMESRWPILKVTRERDQIVVLIHSTDPITKAERVDEMRTSEKVWKELYDNLRKRRAKERLLAKQQTEEIRNGY